MVRIVVAILHEAAVPKSESLMRGYAHDSDTSDNNTATKLEFDGNVNDTASNTTTGIFPQSFVFIFVDTYFPTVIVRVMKIVNYFMKFAIFSNIFGIIAWL